MRARSTGALDDSGLLMFLTHDLPPVAADGGGDREELCGATSGDGRGATGSSGCDNQGAAGLSVRLGGDQSAEEEEEGERWWEQRKAQLRSMIRSLERSMGGVGDEGGGAEARERLAAMKKLGIGDLSVFEASVNRPADEFGDDVDALAGLLRRQEQVAEQEGGDAVSGPKTSDADAEFDDEMQAALTASMQARERSKQELARRRQASLFANPIFLCVACTRRTPWPDAALTWAAHAAALAHTSSAASTSSA